MSAVRSSILCCVVCCLAATVQAQPQVPPAQSAVYDSNTGASYADNEVLVKFRSGTHTRTAAALHAKAEAAVTKTISRLGIQRVRGKHPKSVAQLLAAYRAMPDVEWVEPNFFVEPQSVPPSDARFSEQYALHNEGQTGGIPDADVDWLATWSLYSQGGLSLKKAVTVAVIDSGVTRTHEDLAANLWTNSREIAGNGIDDDQNGRIDDVYGWDFAAEDNDPADTVTHGTHVAGIVGAVTDNNLGVAGTGWNLTIMPLQFLVLKRPWFSPLGCSNSGLASDAVEAIVYAVDQGAKVLNNSWGGGGYSQALYDAILYANQRDVLFVAAAGNATRNLDATPFYPCSYAAPNMLCVGATDASDNLATYSNYGSAVTLAAPGTDILSTVPPGESGCGETHSDPDGDGYGAKSGTSMATPMVAAAAAMIFSKETLATVSEVKQILASSSDVLPGLAGTSTSGGRLNMQRALALAAPNLAFIGPVTAPPSAVAGQTITFQFTVVNSGTTTSRQTLGELYLNQASGASYFLDATWIPKLAAGESTTIGLSKTVPGGIPAGGYHLSVLLDSYEVINESNEGDNTGASAVFPIQ